MKYSAKNVFYAFLFILSLSVFFYPQTSLAEEAMNSVKNSYNAGSSVDELQQMAGKPTNKIHIPGLEYSDIKQVKENGDTYLYIPYIGEYLAAVYRYLVVFAGLIAVIIIIIGGIQWTASGGNSSSIESAKKRIIGALTGLGLAAGSYIILYTINPELVAFRSLKIKYVVGQKIESLSFLSDSEYSSFTGQATLPPGEVLKKAVEITNKIGLDDPCYLITIMGKESGGNPAAIGNDENYPRAACVPSRREFLHSGVKQDGTTFTSPFKPNDDSYKIQYANDCAKFNATKGPDGKLLMNAPNHFDISSPPDYGLDWRFSHGFGLGQITLKGNHFCGGGERGIAASGGPCLTIPQLLTVDAAALSAGNLFKTNLDCATRKGYSGDQKVQAAFWAYAAGCGNVRPSNGQDISDKPGVPRAWAHFQACKKAPNHFEDPDPSGGSTEDAEPEQ